MSKRPDLIRGPTVAEIASWFRLSKPLIPPPPLLASTSSSRGFRCLGVSASRYGCRLLRCPAAGRSTADVKEEMDDCDDHAAKPYTPNLKVETGDGEGKTKISSECETVYTHCSQLRRRHGGKFGSNSRYAYVKSIAQLMKSSPTLGQEAQKRKLMKYIKFAYSKDPARYHNVSCSQAISAIEELIELSGTIAEISPHVWDLNHKNETLEVICCGEGVDFTNGRFDGRLEDYVHELRKSCLIFMLKVMETLGTVVYSENLHRRFGKDAEDIINQWMNKQKIHPKNSTNNIDVVDQCICLARYVSSLIKGASSSVQDAIANLAGMFRRDQLWSEFAPEALRMLSLLDCGAFRKAGDKMEIPLHAISSYDSVTQTKGSRVISLGSNTSNLETLATILQVLKDIGSLDASGAPSPGEMVLLEQILEHVSLCIDGFLSSKPYHNEMELCCAPASTLRSKMRRINSNGVFRGQPLVYFDPDGKYLVESMLKRFERVQEDIDLMIPSLQHFKSRLQDI
ncbi:hypothetical protein ACP70R_036324 [Stipagrostis hirtigluma subsp. patula]